jgi:hypothetical protein
MRRLNSSIEKDDRMIRMMMIDENNDVNDPDRMNVPHRSVGHTVDKGKVVVT